MRNILHKEPLRNLSTLERMKLHRKIFDTFRELSSDRRDEIFELVKFLIQLQTSNTKGRSEYQLLTKVKNVLNDYLSLLEQVRQGYRVSQSTSIQYVNLVKFFQDGITSHSEIEKLSSDEFDNLIEVAKFLQNKNLDNLDRVEEILNSWLRKAENIR